MSCKIHGKSRCCERDSTNVLVFCFFQFKPVLTLSPRNKDNLAFWYLLYSPKADIPALLNMPNTPKAEISACPSRPYARMACISAGELRVN